MKNLKTISVAFLLLSLLFTACKSPQRLLETGNYNQTIDRAVRKLAGKKKKDPVLVSALEEAFAKATQSDMRQIEMLKKSGTGNIWAKIHQINKGIATRQNYVAPLLPLVDKRGYQAAFNFVKVNELLTESSRNAAEFHYIKGTQSLVIGREGDKNAARHAYEQFDEIKNYASDYKDVSARMHEAHQLGIIHILYQTGNRAGISLHPEVQRELSTVSVRDFDTFWKKYYTHPAEDIRIDYRIEMDIETLNAGREVVREREYVDYKDIEDGFDYVLDQNGNVLKDTLGNDIKIPRIIRIEAFVFESYQFKDVFIKGRLNYFDAQTNELTYSDVITAEAIFENYASTFRGDRRALSNDSRRRIGNSPLPFPTDHSLIMTAVRDMRQVIKQKMARRDLRA